MTCKHEEMLDQVKNFLRVSVLNPNEYPYESDKSELHFIKHFTEVMLKKIEELRED